MFIIANEFSNYLSSNQQQIIDKKIQFLKYNSSNKSNILVGENGYNINNIIWNCYSYLLDDEKDNIEELSIVKEAVMWWVSRLNDQTTANMKALLNKMIGNASYREVITKANLKAFEDILTKIIIHDLSTKGFTIIESSKNFQSINLQVALYLSNINKSLLQCNSKMLINKDDVLVNNESIMSNSYTLKKNKVH